MILYFLHVLTIISFGFLVGIKLNLSNPDMNIYGIPITVTGNITRINADY